MLFGKGHGWAKRKPGGVVAGRVDFGVPSSASESSWLAPEQFQSGHLPVHQIRLILPPEITESPFASPQKAGQPVKNASTRHRQMRRPDATSRTAPVDDVNLMVYSRGVIGRIRHKGLAELYRAGNTRKITADRIRKCARILQLLDAASKPEDMDVVGLHFHALQGTPKAWSVRVTANYRMTFGWSGDAAIDIDLEDYH